MPELISSAEQKGTKPTEDPSRVLLVDDDLDICRDYARALRRSGLNVVTATSAPEALTLLANDTVNVIVSDIAMPSMSGIELLRVVRERDLDLPVVLMTGSPSLDTAIQALDYGATSYLRKPVDLERLTETVWRAADLHKLAVLRREVATLPDVAGLQLGDRASLDARFSAACAGAWPAFQPIVTMPSRTLFGYEALLRSSEPSLARPPDLLDAAARLGRLHELGRVMRGRVAEAFGGAPPGLIFVNLHPLELNDSQLFAAESPLSTIASRVVLEITERASLDEVDALGSKLSKLRSLGYRIALDDLGAGYAGLSSVSRLEPDFVKLDMSLIRDIDRSARKRALVRGIGRICSRDLGMQVICEGVERAEESETLIEDGFDLMQGYLFGKPAPTFVPPSF
jgi:EAL domain-containing protein (putative c-di-GMP-specific phosphodiesterase class I)/CheY-like chemotaxis protein